MTSIPADFIVSPAIGSHRIYRCDALNALVIDERMVKFTRMEYRLLVPLLAGRQVEDAALVQAAFACSPDPQVRKNVSKYIDKIRGKIRLCGLDVHRITRYGYILLDARM
jgi:DNA-binding response OmpR family regulator